MDIKEEVKEESSFSNFYSQNKRERFIKDLVKKVKIETVTSSSDIKTELEDSMCSQNEEYHLLRSDETIKESKIVTKIDIKEEEWWLPREDPCISDNIKNGTQQDLYSKKTPSLCKEGVSSYTSHLSSSEDIQNDTNFNMNKDGVECESDRKYQKQKHVVTDMPSAESSVCTESSDDGKIVSVAYSLKQGPHKCNICNKAFTRLSHLKRHKLFHEGIKLHKCNICDKAFTVLSHLKRHKLIHEGIKPHKCNICNKAFTQLSSLNNHKLIHEGMKPYKCNICSKPFSQLSTLNNHKLIHEGIKSHICNICNKAFTRSSILKEHKLIHEGIKPHKCDICNKAFIQSSILRRHKLIHEGIKSHKCNICNNAFTRSSILNQHKLIHEGIKPHKCNICNKAFTQLSSLKRHTLIHQDKLPQ